jgi:hypothetical protein
MSTGTKGPGSSRLSSRSIATVGTSSATSGARSESATASLIAESFMMCATVSRGSLWLTQTETRPAAMVAM